MIHPDDALVEPSIAASAAAADSSGPPPSSETPEDFQEPPGQPGSDEQRPDVEAPDSPREFDPKYRDPFTGLLFLGYLEDTIRIYGHTFRIATPTQNERIEMGLLHKPYVDSLASEIAYQTLLVSAYLLEVDGEELPQPILNKSKSGAVADRFRWVSENLRPPVIDQLFSSCLVLEGEVRQVLEAMGEARG